MRLGSCAPGHCSGHCWLDHKAEGFDMDAGFQAGNGCICLNANTVGRCGAAQLQTVPLSYIIEKTREDSQSRGPRCSAGSIRVPASYCGLFGFRPSHERVSLQGALPMAPSFDTGQWHDGSRANCCPCGQWWCGDQMRLILCLRSNPHFQLEPCVLLCFLPSSIA